MNKSECEWCGTPVRIVGNTTKHYEPLIEWNPYLHKECMDEMKRLKAEKEKLLKANEIMREALVWYSDPRFASTFALAESLGKKILKQVDEVMK